ncbi:MAG: hypothetical protein CML46_11660 [Rhodobacteraceae bacterium]|nr:hypothetical protein [Paracoccaceae bacterium]MBR27583.1 hypothetical protein [Paracoccaceae bacterium]
MTGISDVTAWAAIITLGFGTYFVRASFLLLAGGRAFPTWAMRLLRYVPVTVLPALAAPMAMWPRALEGETDPARIAGAAVTIAVGILTRSLLGAIVAGLATFLALGALF